MIARVTCTNCGLVNFAEVSTCRRCRAELRTAPPSVDRSAQGPMRPAIGETAAEGEGAVPGPFIVAGGTVWPSGATSEVAREELVELYREMAVEQEATAKRSRRFQIVRWTVIAVVLLLGAIAFFARIKIVLLWMD